MSWEAYYQNGKICIYNYETVTADWIWKSGIYRGIDGNIGTGRCSKRNAGTVLIYSAEAQYLLMNDIEMDNSQIWTVADSFTDAITGESVTEDETPVLYDKDSDHYIYLQSLSVDGYWHRRIRK